MPAIAMTRIQDVPFNPVTGKNFSLKNTGELLYAMELKQYTDMRWAGFHQWKQLGRVVKGNEHGTHITMMKTKKVTDKKGNEKVVTYPSGCTEFNFEQTIPL